MKITVTFCKRPHAQTATLSVPNPPAGHLNLCLCQRLLDTHRQVCISLLWGHCSFLLGPAVCKVLFVPSKSLFPQSPLASKVKFSGGFQSICQIPRVGNLLWVLELFLTVREFLWYNCSAIFGLPAWWLYGGINSNLLQEGLCHRLCDPGSVQFSHSVVSDSLRSMDLQHSRLPCPSPTPEACSNSCPFSW